MRIGRQVDNITNTDSPGERFRDHWLESLPRSQWPAYIDDSAELIQYGIKIGDTALTSGDFASETAEFYTDGLAASTGVDLQSTTLPLGRVRETDIGAVAWVFTRLKRELRQSKHTSFENTSRAIEAALNKALLESVEAGTLSAEQIETIRLPENADVVDLVAEVFCRPRGRQYVDSLVTLAKESRAKPGGLLRRLEEPRMVTELWEHQQAAFESWCRHGCRGYVDMATATGKTVLGLAAIAHHFGRLHPADAELTTDELRPDLSKRATVVVVAHREIILDQWKREFDRHLNIPEQSSARGGEETVSFDWGDVHFSTPKRALKHDLHEADLVVLDETHHYLGSSGFGQLLDEADGHLLALSGSVDETNERTLERRGVPNVFEFSLEDGRRQGVIPQCDWDVWYVPYESHTALTEITQQYEAGYEQYNDGPSQKSLSRLSDYEQADFSFETLSEARSLAQSSAGRALKEYDATFREFTSSVKSRQLTKYNLSPTLTTVSELILQHVEEHKCVVLLESGDEIKTVQSTLKRELGEAYDDLISIVTADAEEDPLAVVERFDDHCDVGALIGTATTLGEGVDIKTADVGINRGRGQLSRSLIQRLGRILRNPDGDKQAQFHHVVGLPTEPEAMLPVEDGIELLEVSSQLLTWGAQFEARPVFHAGDDRGAVEAALVDFEQAGAKGIETRVPQRYEWPDDSTTRSRLEELLEDISAMESDSVLLSIEREERSTSTGDEGSEVAEPDPRPTLVSGAQRATSIVVDEWAVRLLSTVGEDRPVRTLVSDAVRQALQADVEPRECPNRLDEDGVPVGLNPTLAALVQSRLGTSSSGSTSAFVQAAIVDYLRSEQAAALEDAEFSHEIGAHLREYQSP